MSGLLLTIGLQVAFFVVLMLEMLLPSGGILSVLALALLAGSWYVIQDLPYSWAPTVFLAIDAVLIPISIFVGLKWMRRSPLGNREELRSDAGFQVRAAFPDTLLGQQGKVLSTLRPSGKIQVDGQIYEALSEGSFIEAGATITVKSIAENKLIVQWTPEKQPGHS